MGGTGDDVVIGQGGDDGLYGGDGLGGIGNDYLDGGNGNDELGDFVGSNQLFGGPGGDLISLSDFDSQDADLLASRNFVDGGIGDDQLRVSVITTKLPVIFYADTASFVYLGGVAIAYVTSVERYSFSTGDGDDTLFGGNGEDWFDTGSGANIVNAGGGADFLFLGGGLNQGYGGDGDDMIQGGNVLVGGAGDDVIQGIFRLASDLLIGDDGDDDITGSGTIFAGAGNDKVDASDASIDLGIGADRLTLREGTNFVQLGASDGVRDLVDVSTGSASDLGTSHTNVVWDFESGVDAIDVPFDFTFTNNLDLDGDGLTDDAEIVTYFPPSNFAKITAFVETELHPGDFI